jgi:cytochrome P450
MNTVDYDPYDSSLVNNPFPIYARLRDESPVYYNDAMDFWALSRYDDVVRYLNDPERFSNAHGNTLEGDGEGLPLLVAQDPPQHADSKRQSIKFFQPARVREIEPFIRAQATGLLNNAYERHGATGTWDAFKEFCLALPFAAIGKILSIPESLHAEIINLSNQLLNRDEPQESDQRDHLYAQILTIYMGLVAERRSALGNDPISELIKSDFDDFELAVRFFELTFSGYNTTAKAMANALLLLSEFPDQKRRLLQDPSLLSRAVEEVFRFDPPTHTQRRTTMGDVVVRGRTIPAGARVLLLTGSAARDPEAFSDPDDFDITRQPDQRSVVFGYGIHKCLGVHLARLELSITIEVVLKLFPDYEISVSDVTRSAEANVRGVNNLPMRLGGRARPHE